MDTTNPERRIDMRRKIYTLIAKGAAVATMITGCFLDSVYWWPIITMGILLMVLVVSVFFIDLEVRRGR